MRKRAVRKVVVATCAMLTFASFASAQSITLSGDYDPIYDGSLPWNVGGNIQNGFQFGDFLLGFEANGMAKRSSIAESRRLPGRTMALRSKAASSLMAHKLNFDDASLGNGLVWDTGKFSSTGTIRIAAIPEPSCATLIAFLGCCVWRVRRRSDLSTASSLNFGRPAA